MDVWDIIFARKRWILKKFVPKIQSMGFDLIFAPNEPGSVVEWQQPPGIRLVRDWQNGLF